MFNTKQIINNLNCKIIFNPTPQHILQIKNWLKKEEQETREGFYCNWHIIIKSYHLNDLTILLLDNQAIGFIVFSKAELIVEINIAEVNPKYRAQGFGKVLIEKFLDNFSAKGYMVSELYCAPPSSQPIWERLKFTNFPIFQRDPKIRLYRSLVTTLTPVLDVNVNDEVIELWNDEPFRVIHQKPNWIWKVIYKLDSQQLIHPIIHPAFYEWQICWRIGDNILLKDKVKYFNLSNIEFGNFIIIRELPKKLRINNSLKSE
jgi:GNAT superfamily N-acetyltransferase